MLIHWLVHASETQCFESDFCGTEKPVLFNFFDYGLLLLFSALAIKWCVKTRCLCLCSGTTVLRGGRSWREGSSGWCLQAPGGTRQNGAHSWGSGSKVYLSPCFPAVLFRLCELTKLQRVPGSQCFRIFWVVGVPLPSSLCFPCSSEDMEVLCCEAADDVPLVPWQALLNAEWAWWSTGGRDLLSCAK